MARKNHLMLAAMSVLQHAAEMCEDGRSHKAIRKYLKQGVGMVKQAAASDAQPEGIRKPLKERIAEAFGEPPGQPNGPAPAIAAKAVKTAEEPKKPGLFSK